MEARSCGGSGDSKAVDIGSVGVSREEVFSGVVTCVGVGVGRSVGASRSVGGNVMNDSRGGGGSCVGVVGDTVMGESRASSDFPFMFIFLMAWTISTKEVTIL